MQLKEEVVEDKTARAIKSPEPEVKEIVAVDLEVELAKKGQRTSLPHTRIHSFKETARYDSFAATTENVTLDQGLLRSNSFTIMAILINY